MARRNSTGGIIGLIVAALCFAAALFVFQAHASASESGLFIAQAHAPAR